MFLLAVSLCLTASAFAAPASSDVAPEKLQPTVIPIVSQSDELELNGTYKFSYETGNGIKREETSYDKIVPKARSNVDSNEGGEDSGSDEIHVQIGSYSYTAPDGTVISVKYIADENGFRPIGDHIPRVPSVATSSSAEKSGRALEVSNSDIVSKTPALVARIADVDVAQSELKTSSIGKDKAVAGNNSTSSESVEKESSDKDTATESVKDSQSTTEATSSEQSTPESTNATKTSADVSTTQVVSEESSTAAESSSEAVTTEKANPSTSSA